MEPTEFATVAARDIDRLFQETQRGKVRGQRVGGLRRVLAYGLKAIAAGGSLLIAADVLSADAVQGVGVGILTAILVDSVTSNHKRLLAEVEAGYAFGFLADGVANAFNRTVSPLAKAMRRAEEAQNEAQKEEIQAEIDQLELETHERLSDGIATIKKKLAENDLKALQAISLDNERAVSS